MPLLIFVSCKDNTDQYVVLAAAGDPGPEPATSLWTIHRFDHKPMMNTSTTYIVVTVKCETDVQSLPVFGPESTQDEDG